MVKKTGLGQGVNLLFGEDQERFFECDVDKIIPNKFQPRTHFHDGDLDELADSIREQGVIQPLIVSPHDDGTFELIAGERRWRASKLVGLKTVPVVTMEVNSDDSLLELALIENIQRTDLTPIEEAEAYKKLIDQFGYTQEQTAKRVGKNRTTIANLLRLLKLPGNIQADVNSGTLSEGHARALIRLIDDPVKLSEVRNQIIKNGLTVRQTEKLIKKSPVGGNSNLKKTTSTSGHELPTSYKQSLITQLTNHLNSKIVISENGSRGKIEIEYYSMDDLGRLSAILLCEN